MAIHKRLLVPLDGSELAETVFSYVRELSARVGFEVVLLHVCDAVELGSISQYRAYIERAVETVRQQSEELQKRTGTKGEQIVVKGDVVVDYPAEGILRYADEHNIGLILMATHGRSGVKRWGLGSVADKVVRASKIPVCLVRGGASGEIIHDKWPTRTILVTLDGSELAESVLLYVEALVRQTGVEAMQVLLLAVCEPVLLPAYYPSGIPLNWEDHMARIRRRDEEYLSKVEKKLKDAGLNVKSEVLVGKPAEEIVNYVSKNPVDFIAMSTHGRSGVSRWVFGSVAEKVLLGVNRPILLIRPR